MKDLFIWEFPISVLTAVAFVAAVVLCSRYVRKCSILRFICSRSFSAILISVSAVLCAIEGTWKLMLPHSWPFLIFVLFLMFCLGLVVCEAIKSRKSFSYIIAHSGLFLILFGGFFGAPDVTDAILVARKGAISNIAYTSSGHSVPLKFDVELKDFSIDYYGDGSSPKQYTSTLSIGENLFQTSVNHPLLYKGFCLYQSDYDRVGQSYSVLKIVRNPWMPIVFAGMFFLVLAALLELRRTWKSKYSLIFVVLLAAIFCFIALHRIKFGTLMPALRSLWFIPHIIIYMLAYSVLAISLVCGVVGLFGKSVFSEVSLKLLSTASSLLIIGMLCGAVWAQNCWGDWWSWDGKECWAAATWLFTLLGSHLPRLNKGVFIAVLLSFASVQMTWYGVNYLPSSNYSLHTYSN